MVMTLNSIRRWCFITKNDVRWTVFLTILCVWCSVCGGVSSPTTTSPTTPVSQTASEVCIIKTKASITTAMTPKQNQKCTAVTFTITPPTTTVSTNEASTEYPTTATVSLTTDSTATENIASTEKPSSTITSEAYTTTDVTPTTNSELTAEPPATENAAPTTALSSSTTTVSPSITPLLTTTTTPPTATTFVTPTTTPVFSEITTFLTTTSLQNATQISVTDNPAPTAFEAQSTISLATTATSAPTLIIVTQETTMSLSMSTTNASPTTTVTPLPATTQTTAVVNSTLLFNSSSPVPSEAQVLTAIKTLRQSRESQFNDSVKVVNVTYLKISETSYAVVFTFNLNNISMPVDSNLRGDTYQKVQNTINNALNTLLNEPGKQVFVPKTSNFTSTLNQIDGSMGYSFQDGDVIQPVSFLKELRSQTALTTASPLSTIKTSPPTLLGRVIIYIRLVFVTSGSLPNEKDIVQVANTLLYSRLLTKLRSRAQPLSDPVNFANITYTKINETAYTLNLGFEISNVSMSEKLEFRNETYLTIQDSINTLLNKILNDDSAPTIKFQPGDFTEFSGNSTTIQANVTYVFSNSSITQPSIFIQELLQVIKESTLTTASTSATTLQPISKVFIKIRLVFVTLGPIPSESDVLRVVKSILASNLTTKLTSRAAVIPSNPVIRTDVSYSKINDTAYALDFEFEINNLSVNDGQRNQAYVEIQNKINNLVIEILNNPSAVLPMIKATFTDSTSSSITANVTYVFSQNDSNSYTAFGRLVGQLFITFTTPAPTTINTTVSNNSTNAAWVVAIIVPVAIVLGLVPCWILLCCLLCGCCAAIRRRWHRRQSYNVQYTTRNSLF